MFYDADSDDVSSSEGFKLLAGSSLVSHLLTGCGVWVIGNPVDESQHVSKIRSFLPPS